MTNEQPPHVAGMPIVPMGPTGLKTLQLLDQAHGHVIPRPDGRRASCAGPNGCWTCHMERLVYESRRTFFIDQGLVLKPGDKVLLIAPTQRNPDEIATEMNALRARFPEVEFTVVSGYTGVQVAQPNG